MVRRRRTDAARMEHDRARRARSPGWHRHPRKRRWSLALGFPSMACPVPWRTVCQSGSIGGGRRWSLIHGVLSFRTGSSAEYSAQIPTSGFAHTWRQGSNSADSRLFPKPARHQSSAIAMEKSARNNLAVDERSAPCLAAGPGGSGAAFSHSHRSRLPRKMLGHVRRCYRDNVTGRRSDLGKQSQPFVRVFDGIELVYLVHSSRCFCQCPCLPTCRDVEHARSASGERTVVESARLVQVLGGS